MDYEKRIQGYLDDERVSEDNRQKMREFNEFLKASGKKAGTRHNYIITLSQLGRWLGQRKFKEDVTEKDMIEFINYLKSERKIKLFGNEKKRKVKANTGILNAKKFHIRKFYQFLYGMKKKKYPDIVDWFEFEHYDPELDVDTFLTLEEFENTLTHCRTQQQRAKVMVLRYGGLRVGESLCLNVGDIQLSPDGTCIVDLSKKTEEQLKNLSSRRKVTMVEGSQDLLLWIRQHPMGNNPDAPLWIDKEGNRLTYNAWYIQLKGILKRAKITKKYHSHIFRHERVTETDLKLGMTDAIKRKMFGWTRKSKMPGHYTHIRDEDVATILKMKMGIDVEGEVVVKPRQCDRCRTYNSPDAKFCSMCGLLLVPQSEVTEVVNRIWKKEPSTIDDILGTPEMQEKIEMLVYEALQSIGQRKLQKVKAT